MRGISTVVDATVFLLLVGAAAGTLVVGTADVERADRGSNPAVAEAGVLATSTATVNYSLAPAARRADGTVSFPRTRGPGFRRRAHGTLASLLADAAVGATGIDGERLSHRSRSFETAVGNATRARLARPSVHVNVTAVWRPYPGAPIGAAVHVGEPPPATADVNAAAIQPASGVPAVDAERAARTGGYDALARTVADGVVRGLFPPNETRLALRGTYPVDVLTAQRYRRTARLFDAPRPGIGSVPVTESNDRLAGALAERLETDMRAAFDSPGEAARAVDLDSARVTVRTWSA